MTKRSQKSVAPRNKLLEVWFALREVGQIPFAVTLGLVTIVLRQPTLFSRPQFWAEDGVVFYKPAYVHHFGSLLQPYAGSLQTFMRLVALLSQVFPLYAAPAIFLLAAVAIQLLPIFIIHTKRFRSLFPNAWARWLITLFYLAQPNTWEIHANLTNTNWHIAISALLLLIGPEASSRIWRWFDRIIITLACLTGPFAFFLLPIIIIHYWYDKNSLNREKLILVAACCIVQFIPLALAPATGKVSPSLVISHKRVLTEIVGTQIAGVTTLGSNTIGNMPLDQTAALLLAAWLSLTTVAAFIWGNRPLRLFIIFGLLVLGASLFRSETGNLPLLWQSFLGGQGDRYFFIPVLVWFTSLVYLLRYKSILAQSLLLTTLAASFLVAIPADFKLPVKPNSSFYSFAHKFEASPKGKTLCNQVNPATPDKAWLLCLKKH